VGIEVGLRVTEVVGAWEGAAGVWSTPHPVESTGRLYCTAIDR